MQQPYGLVKTIAETILFNFTACGSEIKRSEVPDSKLHELPSLLRPHMPTQLQLPTPNHFFINRNHKTAQSRHTARQVESPGR